MVLDAPPGSPVQPTLGGHLLPACHDCKRVTRGRGKWAGPGSDPLPFPLPLPLPDVPRSWSAEITHRDALRCEAQGGTALKRPSAAGSVFQALDPSAEKRVEMGQHQHAPTLVDVGARECGL
jgi:hypothetical protein